MIADIHITEKSFGAKELYKSVKFSVDNGEKVGVIGRNGVGKSTLFGILAGTDRDFSGEVAYKRGVSVVATAQEHGGIAEDTTVLQYILQGLPEYAHLSHIVQTYPETMGDDMKKITEYSEALQRFYDKGFYQIEEQIERELERMLGRAQGADMSVEQGVREARSEAYERYDETSTGANNAAMPHETSAQTAEPFGRRLLRTLSGGQKRLVEVVKVMHSDAHLALVDEPTNHMDYVAKAQFIDWMKGAREAMLIITHDRDVLKYVDRIIELKDGSCVSFKGNYDAYLKQNAVTTGTAMNEFQLVEKRIVNLKQKVIDYQRLKEKSRNPATIQKFKRLENVSRRELAELQAMEKPTFWIDRESVENLNYKVAGQYEKFKARNIRMNMRGDESRSKHVLVSAKNLSLGYDTPLFSGINIDLREGEAVELRGRNGTGKTTIIKALLGDKSPRYYAGELELDDKARVGIYEQEIDQRYFGLSLQEAVERMYLDKGLAINETKVRGLLSDYLFSEGDNQTPLKQLSGGQKARFQIISMLANDPQLLILDEPTNHLDLPSIEELETALKKYSGAILYVSHDSYFTQAIGGDVVEIGSTTK